MQGKHKLDRRDLRSTLRVGALTTAATLCVVLFAGLFPVNGVADEGDDPAVVGGSPAVPGSWPAMARLAGAGCGGTLVHPRIVLTAAHCKPAEGTTFWVVLGTHNLTSSPPTGEWIQPRRTIVHPQFVDTAGTNSTPSSSGGHMPYDFMLVTLGQPSSQSPMQVATTGTEPGPGSKLQIAGWGYTQPAGQPSLNQLRDAEVLLRSDQECLDVWQQLPGYFNPQIMRCAHGDGSQQTVADACTGDSGGPLATPATSSNGGGDPQVIPQILVGVTAWGPGDCGAPTPYGVYGRVAAPEIRDWILGAHAVTSVTSPITFSELEVGEESNESLGFRIYSEGATPLQITAIEDARHAEVISHDCIGGPALQIGDYCDVEVVFTPRAVGAVSDHIVVRSNSAEGPLRIPVGGVGLAVPYKPKLKVPNQKLRKIAKQGKLKATCKLPRKGKCTLTVEVKGKNGRSLNLGNSKSVIAKASTNTNSGGKGNLTAKLSAKVRKAVGRILEQRKTSKRKLRLTFRLQTVDQYGQTGKASTQVLLR